MLIEGGIYKDKKDTNSYFIYLIKDHHTHYCVEIQDDEYSNQSINDQLYEIQFIYNLSVLKYWVSPTDVTKYTDGYLGQINKDLYDELLKALKKSNAWSF